MELSQKIEEAKKYNSRDLYLLDCRIKELPPEIGQLKNLERLFLFGNQLKKLPPEIGQLKNLTTLSLAKNLLKELPPEIGKLENLQRLYLFGNQLKELPAEIGQLKSLETLSLYKNQLMELSPEIGKLKNLRRLYLVGNHLTKLPREILLSNKLQHLNITENPFEINKEDVDRNQIILEQIAYYTPDPRKVLSLYFQIDERLIADYWKRPEKLVRFLESQEEIGTNVPLLEGKVVIVGNGNAGKTSLRQRLLRQPYRSEGKTKGVKIDRWNLQVRGEDIKLNVWDFGGQEIYHTTHKFFFRSRCIYILVVDKRAGMEKYLVKYWLRQIKEFSFNAPLILVFNKAEDENTGEIEPNYRKDYEEIIKEYKEIYSNIKDCYFISCQVEPGLHIEDVETEIRRSIENDLPEIFNPYKKEFSEIRDYLRNETKNFLKKDDFKQICENFGLTDTDEQQILRTLLDNIGTITAFEGDFIEDIDVLKPEWITKGVYEIISSYKLSENVGEITLGDIKEILSETEYQGSQHYIIAMMRKFDLCFNENDKYFFPAWFPLHRKDYHAFVKKDFVYQYHYQRDASVEKFLSDFITQNHAQSNTYWRRGIVINKTDARALVVVDSENETITLTVEGKVAKSFLEDIKKEFDEIHSKYNNPVKEEKLISPNQNFEENQSGVLRMSDKYTSNLEMVETLAHLKIGFDKKSVRSVKLLVISSVVSVLLLTASVWVILVFLILRDEQGWNIYEKWTWIISSGIALIASTIIYGYLAFTTEEFSPKEIYNKLIESKKKKTYRLFNFNAAQFEQLQRDLGKKHEQG